MRPVAWLLVLHAVAVGAWRISGETLGPLVDPRFSAKCVGGVWFTAHALITLHHPPKTTCLPDALVLGALPLIAASAIAAAAPSPPLSVEHKMRHPVEWARLVSADDYLSLCTLRGTASRECATHPWQKRVATWCELNRFVRRAALRLRDVEYIVSRIPSHAPPRFHLEDPSLADCLREFNFHA